MKVTLLDFKTVLEAIKEENIRLKVRMHTGWSKDYLYIIGFIASSKDKPNRNFNGVVFSNLSETEGILVNNISTINAFELEHPCKNLKARIIYDLYDAVPFVQQQLHA